MHFTCPDTLMVLFFYFLNKTLIASLLFLTRNSSKALHRWNSKAFSDTIFRGFHTLKNSENVKLCQISLQRLSYTLKNYENALDACYHLRKSPLEVGRIHAVSRSEVNMITSASAVVEYIEFFYCACQGWEIMGNYQVHSVGCVACDIVCAPPRCHAPYSSGRGDECLSAV